MLKKEKKSNIQKLGPVKFLSLGFAIIILTGGFLLSLPISSQSGEFTNFLDAVFTATSATCVTGLTTLNTAQHWSIFGQIIIMLLIELGGLGFMMLPIIFYTLAKKKVNLSTRIVLKEALNLDDMSGVMKLTLYVLKFSIAIQTTGMVLLAIDLVPRYGIIKGLWYALFHAISSFCNAGFDLFGDSLVPFQNDPYILLVISFLIVSGGLGFLVWRDLLQYKHTKRMSMHSKIALMMTGLLLLGGFVIFFFSEHNGRYLVQSDNLLVRLMNTLFMSVTPRTAGFYSVDYAAMSNPGLILTMFLMYIGGTSGSTAGGLKTTTFGVVLIQMISLLKGRQRAEFAGRSIKETAVFRAMTLFFISLSLCVISIMILSATEHLPRQNGIEYAAFEVFSAFGTVGLTMGLTPDLTEFGKLLIIGLMYIGRVGIMTVLFSLMSNNQKTTCRYQYPYESVLVG
ncbi:TrkH family potassium uptake protein [Enterococcus cecorum]|uniref:TrkH family potassium uptake protein n=1 Tax=Enterococcus cecorum TaxID=44008 RepID=UPI000A80C48D|nr:TrkH family potassium uptake protein [Enterococcus cecorum]HLQ88179.1 TrkH family potassium uptake protein [Enterococcus sp.]MCJ0605515.1 TrkH family potassium uptake protein [Enterococcus cecorum]MDZ5548029.1 TrkH family potassium uptake protein [Enterococcus cecorum]MDZ5566697.1 TrkH family potassium uptake protein [Enterococcus cecorum]MDZ5568905.1 TrkH family potassium uptake protein [Enterococcus cecorum]